MNIQTEDLKDFGPKNALLIVGVALVLGALAWTQRPARVATVDLAYLNGQPSAQGQVLGAQQISQDFMKQFSGIQIQTSADTSSQALQNYASQVNIVLQNDNAPALVNDKQTEALKNRQMKFLGDLRTLVVPAVFADYARLLLAGYDLRFQEKRGEISSADAGPTIAAVEAELQNIRGGFSKSIQIQLP